MNLKFWFRNYGHHAELKSHTQRLGLKFQACCSLVAGFPNKSRSTCVLYVYAYVWVFPAPLGRAGWKYGEKEMNLISNTLLDCLAHSGGINVDNWAY